MKSNNAAGIYDEALRKQLLVLKHFFTGSDYREELPVGEDHAAAAA